MMKQRTFRQAGRQACMQAAGRLTALFLAELNTFVMDDCRPGRGDDAL